MFLEIEHSNETQNPALFPSRTTLQLPVPSGRFLNAPDALDPQRLFLVIASDWNTISLYPRMTHYFSWFKSHLECHLLRGSVPAPPIWNSTSQSAFLPCALFKIFTALIVTKSYSLFLFSFILCLPHESRGLVLINIVFSVSRSTWNVGRVTVESESIWSRQWNNAF